MDYRSGAESGSLTTADFVLYEAAMPEDQEEKPLPSGVREKHGSWHWVVKHKWTKLCRVNDGRAQLYLQLLEKAGVASDSMWYLLLMYMKHGLDELAESTQAHYRNDILRLLHHFGHFQVGEVEPTHVAQFLEWSKENDRATTGNREKAVLASAFEYGMRKGWATSNPCRGVRRNQERPSSTYVEHATLTKEVDRAPPELAALYGVAYLLGIRQTDLRLVEVSAITPDGLRITESKTGKLNTHAITPTVRQFLQMALEHKERRACHCEAVAVRMEKRSEYESAEAWRSKAAAIRARPQIFLSHRGLPWTVWGLQSALRRFEPAFQFRQLRPKAQTDAPNENILGHTGQMRERYTRRRKLDAVK
jgi:site-specific recombinase XerD